jgi:hypothetical protein
MPREEPSGNFFLSIAPFILFALAIGAAKLVTFPFIYIREAKIEELQTTYIEKTLYQNDMFKGLSNNIILSCIKSNYNEVEVINFCIKEYVDSANNTSEQKIRNNSFIEANLNPYKVSEQ